MQQAIRHIKHKLAGHYPDSEITAIIRILTEDVFHQSITDYYMGKDTQLSEEQEETVKDIIARLLNHEPIQYILGKAKFCGLTFHVNKYVLIPRPETAELVELILHENQAPDLKVLDIGTGSGCIAISLALKMPRAHVYAWDISPEALQTARENAESLQAKVTFEERDVLHTVPEEKQLDIIVSNPPYITMKEKADMAANVLEWEPDTALFVPDEAPLLFYEAIARLGRKLLKKGGRIYLEINQAYGEKTVNLLARSGYDSIALIKDLSGKNRIIKATR